VAVRKVLRYPDPRLTAVASSPRGDAALIARVAEDLVDTMRSFPRCVGVAAPQIGEPVRMFAVDCTDHPKVPEPHGLLVLVDPFVVAEEGDARGREGCLSIPDLTGDVHRPTAVTIEASDPSGAPLRVEATGFEARVLLHELDHLDGVLFLDRAVDVFPRRSYG
jgi:peptide deformylase